MVVVRTTDRLDAPAYWQHIFRRDSQEDNALVNRLGDLSEDEKTAFDALLKRLLPDLNRWKIELSRGQSFIEYETRTGARHASDLFGDGMASLFRILLAIFDSTRENIICIDEPELSLHPQAQKALGDLLSETAIDRQVIISTHSPYFVRWSDMAYGAVICRLTQQADGVGVGTLNPETLNALQGLENDWQKPSLLDAVAREVFFAEEVVFFEGQEDVPLVRKFAEDNGLPSPAAFGYGAGGSGNIQHFLQMASDLSIPAVAIFVGDKEDEMTAARERDPGAMIELLPTPDIRDKPARDGDGRETEEIAKEGLFDRHGEIKDDSRDYLTDLLNRIRAHFDKQP